jgi:ParB family chromosome partitioning protein
VRPVRGKDEHFEIIAGERRWRAAQRAGLHDVPIVSVEATDDEALQLAIIENVQRTDLNPLEEAMGYQTLASSYQHTHDDIAKMVGKSRVHVTNTLRLLKLSEKVQAYIHAGKLTAGHARMLVGQPNADELAEEIVERGLNVRQVEALTRGGTAKSTRPPPKERQPRDPNVRELEERLSAGLGLKVSITTQPDGSGEVMFHFGSPEQLDELLRRLGAR